MKIAKIIAFLGVVAMSVALLNGFIRGDFLDDGGALLENPWGIVSLVDLYVGFILFSLWIIFREHSLVHTVLWVSAMMILGFFAGALYVLIVLFKSEDWEQFFLGVNKKV